MADQKIPMTPRGAQQLKDELKRRKEVDRFAIVKAIEEARGHGDLSENADYSAAKEAQSLQRGAHHASSRARSRWPTSSIRRSCRAARWCSARP